MLYLRDRRVWEVFGKGGLTRFLSCTLLTQGTVARRGRLVVATLAVTLLVAGFCFGVSEGA